MRVLITITSGDAKEALEKLGILAEPSEYPEYYYYEIQTLDDLFSLTDVLDEELVIRKKYEGFPELPEHNHRVIEIYNDYRE